MTTPLKVISGVILFFVTAVACHASEPVPISELKCFMMPKRGVEGKKVVDYREGKLYLCCPGCVRKMEHEKRRVKYLEQANHQLVQTGQYEQVACPFDGTPVNDDSPMLTIGRVDVYFSSEDHKKAVEEIEKEKDRVKKVFTEESFDSGYFKPVEKTEVEAAEETEAAAAE